MSSYVTDLQQVLSASPDEFAAAWRQFRDRHHAGESHVHCFIQVLTLMHRQVDRATFWSVFIRFCSARAILGRDDFDAHRLAWDAYTLYVNLSGVLPIGIEEFHEVCVQATSLVPAEEVWQFDRVLNDVVWTSGANAILARQATLLRENKTSSLFSVHFHKVTTPNDRPPVIPEAGSVELMSWQHAERWDFFGWSMRASMPPTVSSPFCFDTNHLDGAGLFQLLVGIRLSEAGETIDLKGTRVHLKMHADLSIADARLHFGVGGRDPTDPITDEALARTGYAMVASPLDWKTRTELSVEVDLGTASWRDMGRNPSSPPFFAYASVPAPDLLRHARNLFIILMHDGSATPITGSFRVESLVLER